MRRSRTSFGRGAGARGLMFRALDASKTARNYLWHCTGVSPMSPKDWRKLIRKPDKSGRLPPLSDPLVMIAEEVAELERTNPEAAKEIARWERELRKRKG